MFVHVATTGTWMTKNDKKQWVWFQPIWWTYFYALLKMMKINRQVNSAASYPNLVSFPSSAFMFDINLWIENNHMKCSSHMAFLCVQNFTLLQKRIEIFVANSMIKKNHQFFFFTSHMFFLEIVSFLYMVQVGTNKSTRMLEIFPFIFC
jgi:hypothetical protein